MKNAYLISGGIGCTLLVAVMLQSFGGSLPQATEPDQAVSMPFFFEENQGQFADKVQYRVKTNHQVFFEQDQVTYQLDEATSVAQIFPRAQKTTAKGIEKQKGKVNYLTGRDKQNWHTNIPTYSKVVYEDLYKDIDLVYYQKGDHLEYDFIVQPEANPMDIAMRFEGKKTALQLNDHGDLIIKTPSGRLTHQKPYSYQLVEGKEQEVSSQFILDKDQSVRFEVANYDASLPLIIDPQIVYSSYVGGTGSDFARGIALDSSKNMYITGSTQNSSDFGGTSPTTTVGTTGDYDVFVLRIDADGSFNYLTFVAGNGADLGEDIVVTAGNAPIVVGTTTSTDFPNDLADQPTLGGGIDAFVFELSADGNLIDWSTYLGSSEDEGDCNNPNTCFISNISIDIDNTDNVYVGGETQATEANDFPSNGNGPVNLLNTLAGTNHFIARFSSGGQRTTMVLYNSGDVMSGHAVKKDTEEIYVSGLSASGTLDSNITTGAYQNTSPGFSNYFGVINADMDAFTYLTYFGGYSTGGPVSSGDITIDSNGYGIITGTVGSEDTSWPTTTGAYQTSYIGGNEAALAIINPAGNGSSDLIYSSLFQGSYSGDRGPVVAVDNLGIVYLSGTGSGGLNTNDALQSSPGTNSESYLITVKPDGNGSSDLRYGSHLGYNNDDRTFSIVAAPDNVLGSQEHVYLAGDAVSSDWETTTGAFQENDPDTGNGDYNGFFMHYDATPASTLSISSSSPGKHATGVSSNTAISINFDSAPTLASVDQYTTLHSKYNGLQTAANLSINGNNAQANLTNATPGDLITMINSIGITTSQNAVLSNPQLIQFWITNTSSSGSFAVKSDVSVGTNPLAIDLININPGIDSDIDAIILLGASDNNNLLVFSNDGSGNLSQFGAHSIATTPLFLATGDFDAQNGPDIVTAGTDQFIRFWLNDGTGSFTEGTPVDLSIFPNSPTFVGMSVTDMDNDGDLDVVPGIADYGGCSNTSCFFTISNDGNGAFTLIQESYDTDTTMTSLIAADTNGDGRMDIVTTNSSVDNASTFFATTFNTGDDMDTNVSSSTAVVASNLDGSTDIELVLANSDDTISIIENDGNGGHSQSGSNLSIGTSNTGLSALAEADFDGDGNRDIATANSISNTASIFFGNGDRTFDDPISLTTGTSPRDIATADLNGDGRMDLVTVNNSSGDISILLAAENLPVVAFSQGDDNADEDAGTESIIVSLNQDSAEIITVDYAVTGGTATGSGTDYTLADGTLTFAAGQRNQSIGIDIVDDTNDDDNETIIVTLLDATRATLGTATDFTFTINDNDEPVITSTGSTRSRNIIRDASSTNLNQNDQARNSADDNQSIATTPTKEIQQGRKRTEEEKDKREEAEISTRTKLFKTAPPEEKINIVTNIQSRRTDETGEWYSFALDWIVKETGEETESRDRTPEVLWEKMTLEDVLNVLEEPKDSHSQKGLEKEMQRIDALTLIMDFYAIDVSEERKEGGEEVFPDMEGLTEKQKKYVRWAKKNGVLTGYPGKEGENRTLKPEQIIIRAECGTLIGRIEQALSGQ